MMRGWIVAIAVAVAGGAVAQSAAPETFQFLSAKEVGALTDQPGPGPKTAHLAKHDNYDVEYALRGDSGNMAEVHAHTTHYIHILEGAGSVTYGGNVTDAKESGRGEVRGSAITGGKTVAIHAGDYMQIPAGTPHLFNAAAGTKLRYIVFNIFV
jgi:mannose-6-phosphate isomerase-like protein (cupin superfamily)